MLRESDAWSLVNQDGLTLREGAAKEEAGAGGSWLHRLARGPVRWGPSAGFVKKASRLLLCGG